jgi:predicted small secreted protein
VNWKAFLLGAGAGVIAGYFAKEALRKNCLISEEKVLADVKNAFKQTGQVDGSWIKFQPEEFEKHGIKTKVYRGGISRKQDGESKQYEFIADAYTGTIIDIFPAAQ